MSLYVSLKKSSDTVLSTVACPCLVYNDGMDVMISMCLTWTIQGRKSSEVLTRH